MKFTGFIYRLQLALVALCTMTAAAWVAADNLPLWKIEGTKSPVWLLGSVHFLKASDYPLPAAMDEAYEQSQVVVFETDMKALESPTIQLQLLTKGRLPAGTTLQEQLSPETYEQLVQHAAKAGLPAALLDSLKPTLAATMIVAAELVKLGFTPTAGVDHHFLERCLEDGKKRVALETPEFQIDLLTSFSKDEGEALVKTTLEEFETMKDFFTDLVEAWRCGDTEELDKFLNEAKQESPAVMKRFLTDRNARWAPKIKALAEGEKPTLVVVGAGHLVGKESVIDLLQADGLKVVQVESSH